MSIWAGKSEGLRSSWSSAVALEGRFSLRSLGVSTKTFANYQELYAAVHPDLHDVNVGV